MVYGTARRFLERFERMRKVLVVFDLDGTLSKTESYAAPAILDALRAFGVTGFTTRDIADTFGARDEDTIVRFFGARAKEVEAVFWKQVKANGSFNGYRYLPYDGVTEMLGALKRSGCVLAVCSNAKMDYIAATLEKLRIAAYFDELQELVEGCTKADTLRMLLHRVSPDQAFMVGDRCFDREAAAANHIPFIGCGYGYGREKELDGSDYLIASPLELLPIIL